MRGRPLVRTQRNNTADNWCLAHWRGSALGFPRGEAVARIGSSEPIRATDEERRNPQIFSAVRKKAPHWDTLCSLGLHILTQMSPFLIHRFAVPLPPGGRYFRGPLDLQTPIRRAAAKRLFYATDTVIPAPGRDSRRPAAVSAGQARTGPAPCPSLQWPWCGHRNPRSF